MNTKNLTGNYLSADLARELVARGAWRRISNRNVSVLVERELSRTKPFGETETISRKLWASREAALSGAYRHDKVVGFEIVSPEGDLCGPFLSPEDAATYIVDTFMHR